jgi:LCP family protein required for cell wall assembly
MKDENGTRLSNLVGQEQEDMAETAPSRRAPGMEHYQPIQVGSPKPLPDIRKGEHRRVRWGRWLLLAAFLLFLGYLLAPLRTNLLILGTDDSSARGPVGRTDTMILSTVTPFYAGLLGIPRDLWVSIPGVGPQRINTAYFFAEAAQRGSGPGAAVATVRENFGVTLQYYLLIHMAGLADVIDALGGVDVTIDAPTAAYAPGTYHLDGTQALAFARERYSADDFSRMRQGQMLMTAALRKALSPDGLPYIMPAAMAASETIETNVPIWLFPRLGLALIRAGVFGIDGKTINREMVVPFQTDEGAQVLAPTWEAINPVLREMFGE